MSLKTIAGLDEPFLPHDKTTGSVNCLVLTQLPPREQLAQQWLTHEGTVHTL